MTAMLNRRSFLKSLAAGAAAIMFARPQWARAADEKAKPNFVFILADDQGYGDLGCYGAAKIKTPNIDRMAAEGMKFTDFYASTPVCTPTRSSLMTGCYPRRIGLEKHVLFPNSVIGLNPDEITIAELLKAQGYATACIGKWHLGYQAKFLPTRQGFDSFFGIPFSNDMSLPADMTFAKDVKLGAGMTVEGLKGGDKAPSTVPLMRDLEVIEYPVDQTTLTERYTEEACKFIAANKDKPFFLYLPHTMPHYPLHISEKFKGKSAGGLFGDVIECLDWSTGQILKTIKDCGIDGRTLVIYTSDNGAAAGSSGPLKGKKGSTWEGGVREPCIMRWPGKVLAGSVCKEIATIMDVLPTLAKLAGTNAPTDRVIDGKDILPLITGQAGAKTPHEAFFYHTAMGKLAGGRSGKWKLRIDTQEYPPKKKAKNAPATPPAPPPGPQLYDLEADLGEKNNVAAEHPDVVKRLTDLLEKFDAEIKANSRPVGRI